MTQVVRQLQILEGRARARGCALIVARATAVLENNAKTPILKSEDQ
jgi:hypothetical protein